MRRAPQSVSAVLSRLSEASAAWSSGGRGLLSGIALQGRGQDYAE